MKKKSFLAQIGITCLVLLLVLPLVLSFTATPTRSAEVITLKALRAWPLEANDCINYREIIKRVYDKSKGRLVLKDIGGSEVYASGQQLAPLKSGAVDLLLTSGPYIQSTFPEAQLLAYTFGASPSELQAAGFYKRFDEIARTEQRLTFLAFALNWGYNYHIYLTKPIQKLDDMKSMKLRSNAAYDPLVRGLGIPTVTVSFSELYTALQTGVVNGTGWPAWDLTTYGLDEVLKYRVDPPFWSGGRCPILMNAKSFDGLPVDLQKLLVETAMEVEMEFPKLVAPGMEKEWSRLRGKVQVIKVTEAEWLKTQQVAWEGFQKVMQEASPKYAKELIQLVSKFYPPKQYRVNY